jgi:ribonuclease D
MASQMQELYIDSPSQLEALCHQIRNSEWLALDTEFVREKTYYAKLCLLQLCNGEVAACVDPLAVEDLTPLLDILDDSNMVKIFHAGYQDLEIFHHNWQRLPTPLFDTQLAASLLGLGDQAGYGTLVQELLGHRLEKGHARTDWARRPLEQEQLRYALDDVIYLGELYLKLRTQLETQGRGEWLTEEFAELADPSFYTIDPGAMWQRVKGRKYLKGVQLAALQALAAWRETSAERSNRPRRWILKDEVLVELARRQPMSMADLEKIRGLEAGTIKRWGDTLLQLIVDAKALPKEQWPRERAKPPRLSTNQEAIVDLLMCCLRLQGEQESIAASALATRRDLERLVTGDREVEILHGWRKLVAGELLVDVLEGRIAPRMVNGRLELQAAGKN